MAARESERYVPLLKIASGGMATVWVGAARGPLGFSALVAIKEPHPHLVADADFRRTFLEEARLASRIRHANVVEVRDIDVIGDAIRLVLPYVEGASLSDLLTRVRERKMRLPPHVAARIVLDACAGLSAAHTLVGDDGAAVALVHRDVSPQNILVGVDGVARLTDFGISKATDSANPTTTLGTLKGKVGYMAPEYIERHELDARADVFAMGVVLWESLAAQRLFSGQGDLDTMKMVLSKAIPPVSHVAGVDRAFDDVVAHALQRTPDTRTPSAGALGQELERAARASQCLASHADVSAFVRELFAEDLTARRALLAPKIGPSDVSGVLEQPTRAVETHRGWNTTVPMPTVAITPPQTPGPDTLAMETRRLPAPAPLAGTPTAVAGPGAPYPSASPPPMPPLGGIHTNMLASPSGAPVAEQTPPRARYRGAWIVVPLVLVVVGASGVAAWRYFAGNDAATVAPAPSAKVPAPEPTNATEELPSSKAATSASPPATLGKSKTVAPTAKATPTAHTTALPSGNETVLQIGNGEVQSQLGDPALTAETPDSPPEPTRSGPRRRTRVNPSE